jgi:hypothetical protein
MVLICPPKPNAIITFPTFKRIVSSPQEMLREREVEESHSSLKKPPSCYNEIPHRYAVRDDIKGNCHSALKDAARSFAEARNLILR